MGGSIRLRVTVLASVVIAVVMVAATAALLISQSRQLTSAIDDTLRAELNAVSTPDGVDLGLMSSTQVVSQVVGLDGSVLSATEGLDESGPIAPAPVNGSVISVQSVPIDDDPFRVLSQRVLTAEGEVVVHLAINAEEVRESTDALRLTAFVLVPVVIAALAGVVWVMVGRTLRPVEAIRQEVATIGGDRGRRVPEPDNDDEIGRLARTMNAMLERIDRSIERQQRFVADASHELRTPLTRIRTEVEVARGNATAPGAESVLESVLDETIGLQRLIDDLLLLARADAEALPTGADLVDLDDLALMAAERLRRLGTVNVDTTGIAASQAVGSEPQMKRVVENLVDNAARHAATTVRLATFERDGSAFFSVANDGAPIPEAAHGLLFERFGRLDESRSQLGGGTGLGLAIVREIVARHGGTVTVSSSEAETEFVVKLPVPEPSTQPDEDQPIPS